jgi:type VI protein secretion system component VasA
MREDEEPILPPPARRINVSVEVLEERLRNWADDVKRDQHKVFEEIRRLSNKYDNSLGSFDIWRVQAQLTIDYLKADVEDLKQRAALRDELDLVRKKAEAVEAELNKKNIEGSAKMQLLKSQWTWLIAGVFGASTFIGFLIQLRVVSF